jgi:hypothetical protein
MDGYESQIKNNTQDLQIKRIPQTSVAEVSSKEDKDTVVEMKFLALSWLDDFEKSLFDGKTVNKLLNHHEL